jgi:hypothetical protein
MFQSKIDKRNVEDMMGLTAMQEGMLPAVMNKIVAGDKKETIDLTRNPLRITLVLPGGHSLAATKLIARLREIFRIDISLSSLFDRPTIRDLVENIAHIWGDKETVEEIVRTYREVQ